MTFIIDDLKNWAQERKQAYKNRLKKLGLTAVIILVLIVSLVISLGKFLPVILLITVLIVSLMWVFLKFRSSEITEFISHIRRVLKDLIDLISSKKEELKDLGENPSGLSLLELLSHANQEERIGLEEFSNVKYENEKQFEIAIRKKSSHGAKVIVQQIKGVDEDLALASYSDMLDITGKYLGVKRDGLSAQKFERHLVKAAFEKMVGAMEGKNRELLEYEIKKYAEDHLGTKNLDISLSAGGLLAANLGGFSTYTMASSLLAGVGSSLGFTFPFAAYTTLSSALSVVIGPIGIGVLSVWGLHKITAPNIKVTILIVLAVAAIRERLIFEQSQREVEIQCELDDLLLQKQFLEDFLSKSQALKEPTKAYDQISDSSALKMIEYK